jgi:hypothetical protein
MAVGVWDAVRVAPGIALAVSKAVAVLVMVTALLVVLPKQVRCYWRR